MHTPDRIPYEACPLCNSPKIASFKATNCEHHPLYDFRMGSTILWRRCGECEHVFTGGYFTESANQILFSKTNAHQQVGHNAESGRAVSARMVEKVLPYAAEGTWLDVGFGNASLLFTAQEYGFRPVGVDMRPGNVDALTAMGIEAYCRPLNELDMPEQCSVISMADVLEHVAFPMQMLKAAKRLLKPGGVLLLSMPNFDSMVWKQMDEQQANPYWGELEHFHNFGRKRLYDLLREADLTPVRYGISERYRVCMEVIALNGSID